MNILLVALLAQLEEHRPSKLNVTSSILVECFYVLHYNKK